MRELRLAQVLRPAPSPDRIFFHAVWFRGHNNPRYAALLPRLDRLDAYLVTCSDRRILRGIQFRALRRTSRLRHSVLLPAMSRRYGGLLTISSHQVPYFHGPVVVDVDDPKFSAREAELLGRENVAAYVATGERTIRRFEELGVATPSVVIPQGVDLDAVTPDGVDQVRTRMRQPGDTVIGYVAAWLLTSADRGGDNPLFNVDHLMHELWPAIREKNHRSRLWLIGQPSPRVEAMCANRPDVSLLGRLPQSDVLNHVAVFDVALYPRRVTHTTRSVKVAEYMGLGIPTVSYDLDIVEDLAMSGGGLLVQRPSEFVDAVTTLCADAPRRRSMGAAAREYAAGWRWSVLAAKYREILDRYLPR